MTMTLEKTSYQVNAREITPKPKMRSILVATDGSSTAESAFRVAQLISATGDTQVHVLSVLELLPIIMPLPEAGLMNDVDKSRSEAQRDLVRRQLAKFDPAGRWSMELRLGRPGEVITRVARERNTDLIIMGMHKHGLWDRFLGEETAIEIARLTEVPLFIAAPEIERIPRRVVVALDLKPDGLQRVPDALSLLGTKLSLVCVHVQPRNEFLGIDWADLDREYEFAIKERFNQMEEQLEVRGGRGDLVVLHGEIAKELIDFAVYSKAELVVVGINRRPGRTRAVGGRMAARLVRRCTSSLLIVPATPPMEPATAGFDATETLYDSARWDVELREFTSMNAGRRAAVEIDDPALGAFVEVKAYPFLGATYDRRDGRVDIMLGDFVGGEHHLTRSISNPGSIAIRTVRGRDTALSVAHDNGQTLVTFLN